MSKYFRYLLFSVGFLLASLCTDALFAQEKVNFSGQVKDAQTGEDLIGATVAFPDLQSGTTTDASGFFSIQVPKGEHRITIDYIGYDAQKQTINFQDDLKQYFSLNMSGMETQEVEVTDKKQDQNVKGTQMGTVELKTAEIKKIPALMGEVDVMRSLQLLPGVQSGGEGNTGFYVRGGGADQNLILLDDAVVYNTGHLFGFFSVFNADAIEEVKLIKGGMPAEYGGRLSSVIDIKMKEGNMEKLSAEGGIGLISSRLTLQGPIVKGKGAFMISGRRTYIDALLRPFTAGTNFEGNGYFFYDLKAKAHYRFSDNDRISLSFYNGRDDFQFAGTSGNFEARIPWGNTTASLQWKHIFNNDLFVNTSLIYNSYDFETGFSQEGFSFGLFSGVRDWNAKVDFSWMPDVRHQVKFGVQYIYHTFQPSVAEATTEDGVDFNTDNINPQNAHEAAIYIQDEFDITESFKINAGLRFSGFLKVGPYNYFGDRPDEETPLATFEEGEPVQDYYGLEPRLNARYAFNKENSLKASFTRSLQYIHLVVNSGTSLPTDVWVPSTKFVRPQVGYQYALGWFRNFEDNTYETSVELFYKDLSRQIEYRDNYILTIGRELERDFTFGRAEAYGAEFLLRKNKGKTTGWIGYTWSRTTRFFDELETSVFPATYDRRHDLSVVLMHDFNKKWQFSATFVYGTGIATTLPERWYLIGGNLVDDFAPRNNFRLPPYHRLDLGVTLTPQKERKYESFWTFSIYNVYNRLNPYFIFFEAEGTPGSEDFGITAKQVSLFPIIPSVTWNFKF